MRGSHETNRDAVAHRLRAAGEYRKAPTDTEWFGHVRIMLTGHRPGPNMNESAVVPALMDVIRANRPCTVISGGADGADRYWARAAYKLKVPYEVWVPGGYYEHYSLGTWTAGLLWNAEHINHIGGMGCEFDVKNNFIRNIEMIETADKHVVCSHKHPTELIKQKRGGTAHATREIMKRNLPMIWVNSTDGSVEAVGNTMLLL